MCDNYQIKTTVRLKRVSEYCEDDIAREIEAFATWEEKDWEKLKEEMMHEWRKEDVEQIMYTRVFLEEYVSKPRTKDGLKHYYRQYDRISKALVLRDELDSYSQGRLFVAGLPADVRYKVLSKQEVSSHAPTGSVNYLKALKATKAIVETEEMMEHFVIQPERQTSITNLAENLNEAKPTSKEAQIQLPGSTKGKKDDQKEDICLGPLRDGAMRIWKIPGMTWLQTVERQVNMKGAPTSADFGIIKADMEQDSDVEVGEGRQGPTSVDAFGARADIQRGKRPAARPPVTDPVKDARTRATKQTIPAGAARVREGVGSGAHIDAEDD
jgi:hypothetical protein